ncbi:hypothetical protein FRC16_007548 [Serendipita sp. 398]|nr:hypothetical protein FRC16_007548 [Serendipita sp. 398]
MKDNLRVDMINDPTTMKKTWEDGKLQKVVDTWPEVSSTFVELGLMTGSSESGNGRGSAKPAAQSSLARSRSRYGH